MVSPGETTTLLARLRLGDKDALGQLMPLVYDELRRLARHYLRGEREGHTLQPTALVHEAYLRLVGQQRADWQNREQFVGVAAHLMRRILVDYARARATSKRGGGATDRVGNSFGTKAHSLQWEEILGVDEALEQLRGFDLQQFRIVELRYFSGLNVEETAASLGISPRTVKRDWAIASAWLRKQLSRKRAS